MVFVTNYNNIFMIDSAIVKYNVVALQTLIGLLKSWHCVMSSFSPPHAHKMKYENAVN